MKKFYITTAIAYPNGKPHMGHALEIIEADAIARSYRMIGREVVFQTGTDEHGTKIRQTAQKAGMDTLKFIDMTVEVFKDMYQKLDISYDTFVRTTDQEKHRPGVIKLRNKLADNGDIYKKKYSGLYCTGCESFKTPKELVDGQCPDHPTRQIQNIEEENYFFKLSKYAPEIIQKIKNKEYEIFPTSRENEIIAFLEKAEDISFSRDKNALPRGIPVPNDPDQVMYVRCDALSNYITAQGYGRDEEQFNTTRPADIHLIGKDILRFHAAFWPAMLISANITLPKKLLVHGHITMNGKKMGKSTGNIIDPQKILEKHEADALKFTLLYDAFIGPDADFSEERLKLVYESMLIGSRGNLINRITKLGEKYGITNGKFIATQNKLFETEELQNNTLFSMFSNGFSAEKIEQTYLQTNNIKKYLEDRYQIVQKANEFISNQEPRKKYKNPETQSEAIENLEFLLRIVKNLAILSAPFMPNGFEKIKNIFGNTDFSQIQTTKNIENNILEKVFDQKEFPVNLNPEIVYERKEEK